MLNKHSQTKYFILDPNVDHTSNGAINNTLYDDATAVTTLAIGAGLFYKPVTNSGNHIEINAVPGNAMKFIYRRDTSGDKSPLYSRPWEDSDWINSECINGMYITQSDAQFTKNDLHLIGDPTSAVNQIIPQSLYDYRLQVSGHGDRTDLMHGGYNTPTTFASYNSPDFTLTALTVPQQRDIVVSELVLDFNNKSSNMAFAIALESAGTSTATGAIKIVNLGDGTVPVGSFVTIGYSKSGDAHTFTLTNAMAQSFADLETRLVAMGFTAGAVGLVPYVTTGTTNRPAASVAPLAGTTNAMDMLAFISLDEGQAYYDYRMSTKRSIEVGLVEGFQNVPQERVVQASEGSGQAHQLKIQYQFHNRYEELHHTRLPARERHIEFPNAFKSNAWYDYFSIQHCDTRSATSGMPNYNNFTTIIAVVNTTIGTAATNSYFGNGTAAAQREYIVNSLNAFNTANGLNQPTLV